MKIFEVDKDSALWHALISYAENCPWEAGKHLAWMMRENRFSDWEAVFAAVEGKQIAGFCTFLKEDYYPENRYSPWVSSIFVDERFRGRRISGKLIDFVMQYARIQGFTRVYIPSDIVGLYEKYGFEQIDTLQNYGGDVDRIFAKDVVSCG